jgi:hypothetical protein
MAMPLTGYRASPDGRVTGIAMVRRISVSPALIGSYRPVWSVYCRRTSFHLQRCRCLSMRITRHQAKLSSMAKTFLATACRK